MCIRDRDRGLRFFLRWGKEALTEKYKIETAVKEPTVIYLERPLKVALSLIHI